MAAAELAADRVLADHRGLVLAVVRAAALGGRHRATRPATPEKQPVTADEMASAIARVEVELDAALSSLDGWAESAAWRAKRIASPSCGTRWRHKRRGFVRWMNCWRGPPRDMRLKSARARHFPRLAIRLREKRSSGGRRVSKLGAEHGAAGRIRRQAHADLMATLAWISELASMIHLAKFTGARPRVPRSLVAQIAAAVEGVSAVSWPEPNETATDRRDKPTQAAHV